MSQVNSVNGNTLLFTGFFPPCRVGTTGSAIALAGLQTIDGITLNAGDRVLVKDQADATTNGIYAANSGNWVRTSDAMSNAQFFDGMAVVVSRGAQNQTTLWVCTTTDDPVVIGTSQLTFANFTTINSVSPAMQPVTQALTLTLARAAMGLGSAATENIGRYGLLDDASGYLNALGPTSVVTSRAVQPTDNNAFFVASGNATFTLPQAQVLPNGFRFYVFTPTGATAALTPNATDHFSGGATGAAKSLPSGKLALVTTDGGAPGTWYASPVTGWQNVPASITGATTVSNLHKGLTLQLGGGNFFALSFPAGATLDADFTCVIENAESGAVGKGISGVGGGFTLYPGESYLVYNDGGPLKLLGGSVKRWIKASINVYVDSVNGSDDPTLADGLAPGTRAFKTLSHTFNAFYQLFDHNKSQPSITATGVFNESIVLSGMPVGCANVLFINGSAPGAFTWQPAGAGTPYCLISGDGAIIEYSNITASGNGLSGSVFLQLHQQAIADQNGGMSFGGFPSGGTIATDGAGWTFNINAGYGLNGGSTGNHINAGSPGIVNHAGSVTVTIAGTPTVGFFYRSSAGGIVNLGSSITYSGSLAAGCQKWAAQQMSAIYLGGNAANIPGSVAGSPAVGSAPTAVSGWATA